MCWVWRAALSGQYSEKITMATRSRRFLFQRSGISLAAFLVASMSVHDHNMAASAQSDARTGMSAVGAASDAKPANGTRTPHVTKVDFSIGTSVLHHYPTL
jgi:hypothetical protein